VSIKEEWREGDLYRCPYCNALFKKMGMGRHIYSKHLHPKIDEFEQVESKLFHHSDGTKQRLSDIRKEYLRTHSKFNKVGFGVPQIENGAEEKLRKLLESLNLPYDVYEFYNPSEYSKNYEMDFAIPDLRISFEVNGEQHYTPDGDFTEYHKERKNYIESYGWKQVDIYYLICFDSNELRRLVISALDGNFDECSCINTKIIDHRLQRKWSREQEKDARRKESNDKSLMEIERKRTLIINSGVDFSKFGWVTKLYDSCPILELRGRE
jgi:uncharacterized C2H2 Zn-finger protein